MAWWTDTIVVTRECRAPTTFSRKHLCKDLSPANAFCAPLRFKSLEPKNITLKDPSFWMKEIHLNRTAWTPVSKLLEKVKSMVWEKNCQTNTYHQFALLQTKQYSSPHFLLIISLLMHLPPPESPSTPMYPTFVSAELSSFLFYCKNHRENNNLSYV